jgi:arsenite/tail-anchored protein-transporting ATPase
LRGRFVFVLLKGVDVQFLDKATRHLFFTGKGGVGKTSLACAAAVALADRGRRVLLVSTDPASNLDDVFEFTLGDRPAPVPAAPGLHAVNLDPERAAREHRERVVGPFRNVLPQAAVAAMEEQLSGACSVEVAAFDEFSRLLGNPQSTVDYDHVLFDTAPTGHTLRLLSLPSAWGGFLNTNTTGASCLGPLAGLEFRRELYQFTAATLADPAVTTVVLVSRPDAAALREAERSGKELAALGVTNQRLVLNGVFEATARDDAVAVALERRGREALYALPPFLAALPSTTVALVAHGLVGVNALRALLGRGPLPVGDDAPDSSPAPLPPLLLSVVDELARNGHGVVLTMGKGGVGKTTVAAAVAVELARRGCRVHLTTTDPAAHVAAAVGEHNLCLRVSRIDPRAETVRYVDQVLREVGDGLDARGRALLVEELRSPCTEEVAVFRAFAEAVAEGEAGFVILDTAPTGHTLLLLDAAQAYHREVSRQAGRPPEAVVQLLPRLRDSDYTRVLIVTLPEATPVLEAARLQADLARAGIRPFAWILNQCLAPLAVHDPVLSTRRCREGDYITEVVRNLASRAALVPWLSEPPVGPEGLRAVLSGAQDLQRHRTAPLLTSAAAAALLLLKEFPT